MEYKIVVVWNDSLSTSQLTMSKHLKFINVATNGANITVQEVKFKQ